MKGWNCEAMFLFWFRRALLNQIYCKAVMDGRSSDCRGSASYRAIESVVNNFLVASGERSQVESDFQLGLRISSLRGLFLTSATARTPARLRDEVGRACTEARMDCAKAILGWRKGRRGGGRGKGSRSF